MEVLVKTAPVDTVAGNLAMVAMFHPIAEEEAVAVVALSLAVLQVGMAVLEEETFSRKEEP